MSITLSIQRSNSLTDTFLYLLQNEGLCELQLRTVITREIFQRNKILFDILFTPNFSSCLREPEFQHLSGKLFFNFSYIFWLICGNARIFSTLVREQVIRFHSKFLYVHFLVGLRGIEKFLNTPLPDNKYISIHCKFSYVYFLIFENFFNTHNTTQLFFYVLFTVTCYSSSSSLYTSSEVSSTTRLPLTVTLILAVLR